MSTKDKAREWCRWWLLSAIVLTLVIRSRWFGGASHLFAPEAHPLQSDLVLWLQSAAAAAVLSAIIILLMLIWYRK